jgi:mRNA interferase YafQ
MNTKYSLQYSSQFKRDYKRMKKRGANLAELAMVIEMLRTNTTLPAKHKDHPLKGELAGYRDCHIEDDWVLIYRIDRGELTLYAMRTGTHSDIGW